MNSPGNYPESPTPAGDAGCRCRARGIGGKFYAAMRLARISSFHAATFRRISHDRLMRFLEHRIGDQCVLRFVGKWLKAGVLEDNTWTEGTVGAPQGAVISPLPANVYLHYVYDLWVQQWRHRLAHGDVIGICYADDTITGVRHAADAHRFPDDLRARLAKFALELHPEKIRLIPFGRYAKAAARPPLQDRRARASVRTCLVTRALCPGPPTPPRVALRARLPACCFDLPAPGRSAARPIASHRHRSGECSGPRAPSRGYR